MIRIHWDRRFLALADHISSWSKDPSTKVGCVIVGRDREVLATGFNGFPRGIEDTPERLNDRSQKYPLICHGEENAILHAARLGISLMGGTAYVTPWSPCTKCARALIQVGVTRVVFPGNETPDRWEDEAALSKSLFNEAGVEVDVIPLD